jgi:hypothetical protein
MDPVVAAQTQPEPNPPAPTVSPGGTARDFGNMLNYHMGKKHKKKTPGFSAWIKMGTK